MLKPLTNLLLILNLGVLTGCAGSPTAETPATTAPATKPVDISPEITALYNSAVTSLKSGADATALAQFTTLTAKAPQLAGAYINIGLIHLKKQRYKEAEIAFNQAINANNQNAQAQNYLGVTLRELGKFDKAQQAYQQALQLDNNYAEAHLNLGILFDIYLNDLAHALEQYEKYQSLADGKDEQVSKWIADIKLRQSKTK